jgi:hypothetical protein
MAGFETTYENCTLEERKVLSFIVEHGEYGDFDRIRRTEEREFALMLDGASMVRGREVSVQMAYLNATPDGGFYIYNDAGEVIEPLVDGAFDKERAGMPCLVGEPAAGCRCPHCVQLFGGEEMSLEERQANQSWIVKK